MTFRLRISSLAQEHIDEFAVYLRDYSEQFAIEQIDRLNRILAVNLGESPLTWSYFAFNWRALSGISVSRRPSNPVLDHLHGRRGCSHGRHSAFLERKPRSRNPGFVADPKPKYL